MDTMEENWLPVVGYEGLYEVSDLGRVKGLKRGKILKPKLEKNGYARATLHNKGEKKCSIHRLVLQTFLPIEDEMDCDHINHIKNDNRLANLRWCSRSQNIRYKLKKEGLSSQYKGVCWAKGNNKWHTKCRLNGKIIHIGYFDDEREAAKAYNEFIIKHNLQDFAILNDLT
jgi:hypothetical protein